MATTQPKVHTDAVGNLIEVGDIIIRIFADKWEIAVANKNDYQQLAVKDVDGSRVDIPNHRCISAKSINLIKDEISKGDRVYVYSSGEYYTATVIGVFQGVTSVKPDGFAYFGLLSGNINLNPRDLFARIDICVKIADSKKTKLELLGLRRA